MTNAEQRIIEMIERNGFLSPDLKQRYILALFLMDSPAQEDYLKLWEAFDERCKKEASKPFILEKGDIDTILRSVDEVKKELIQKIQILYIK